MKHKIDIKILDKYLDGTASPEEQLIIEAWLAESGGHAPLFEDEESPDAMMYRETAKAAVMERMHLREDDKEEVPLRGSRRVVLLRVAAAAAVLLAVIICGYNWRKQPAIHPVAMKEKKAATSRNRAVLALYNGQEITLETLAVGQKIQAGSITILKTDTNEIHYQVMGEGWQQEGGINKLTVPKSSQYVVVLADGTKVWLNAGSSVSFPAVFAANSRKVGITGEAYFEVAKQLTGNGGNYQPFSVTAGKVEVLVLGTHFNINAYTNEPFVKTTLLEGSVQVKTNKQKIQIRPGEQAQFNHTGQLSVAQPNLEEVTAWKRGYLQFDDTPLEEVFRQIARWYDVDVVFKGTSPQGSFHGKVYPGMTLPEILRGLEVNGARFTFDGTKIIVE